MSFSSSLEQFSGQQEQEPTNIGEGGFEQVDVPPEAMLEHLANQLGGELPEGIKPEDIEIIP